MGKVRDAGDDAGEGGELFDDLHSFCKNIRKPIAKWRG